MTSFTKSFAAAAFALVAAGALAASGPSPALAKGGKGHHGHGHHGHRWNRWGHWGHWGWRPHCRFVCHGHWHWRHGHRVCHGRLARVCW